MNDRMITTVMSSKIVTALLKKGWTVRRIAKTIDAPVEFVEGVRGKRHVLTVKDIEALAARDGQSVNRMILHSLAPVKPQFRPLFDSVRDLLELSESPLPQAQPKTSTRRRRPKSKAA